jgi:glycerophosphoryl diester phosphodiesterase
MTNRNLARRIDPAFGLRTPLLFAHRGGALEAPESTERAFRHAWETVGVDVLELDVQTTRDGHLVVWHGPDLDRVRIRGIPNDPRKRDKGRRLITDFAWSELNGAAWVVDPATQCGDRLDLSSTPEEPDRILLSLDDFLQRFPGAPLNIEMKSSLGPDDVARFLSVLDLHRYERPIVVASADHRRMELFRSLLRGRRSEDGYPLSLSAAGNVRVMAGVWLPFVPMPGLSGWSMQTVWPRWVSSRTLVRRVREAGGGVHVFLSRFPPVARALDARAENVTESALFRILDRGVDGIMTDRPALVKPIIERWKLAQQ